MAKATDVPRDVREHVLERDDYSCRVCGRGANPAALHHIQYRSEMRNNHSAGNLVTVGYAYGHICHQAVHSNKRLWQPALEAIVELPGMTALEWLREQGHDIRDLSKGAL